MAAKLRFIDEAWADSFKWFDETIKTVGLKFFRHSYSAQTAQDTEN